jgi:hypothetical protein
MTCVWVPVRAPLELERATFVLAYGDRETD